MRWLYYVSWEFAEEPGASWVPYPQIAILCLYDLYEVLIDLCPEPAKLRDGTAYFAKPFFSGTPWVKPRPNQLQHIEFDLHGVILSLNHAVDGDGRVLKLLLVYLRDANIASSHYIDTVLPLAVRGGILENVKILLDAGADPNNRAAQGTPLLYACIYGHYGYT